MEFLLPYRSEVVLFRMWIIDSMELSNFSSHLNCREIERYFRLSQSLVSSGGFFEGTFSNHLQGQRFV